MSKTRIVLSLLIMLTALELAVMSAVAPAMADGKFYGPVTLEEVPPEIPHQRALLIFTEGQETLILQSKYRLSDPVAEEFGWVVPVPSVPEVASMDPWYASWLFEMLDAASMPNVQSVREWLGILGLFLLLGTLLGLPIVIVLTLVLPRIRAERTRWGLLLLWCFVSCAACLFVYLGPFSLTRSARELTEGTSIEIVTAEQVGIYDVKVIRSREAADLIEWLNQHRFHFSEEDTAVFEEYLRQGWYFVVATVDPIATQDGSSGADEGLVAPLILRFQAKVPVYPLALTATAGQKTQILLYLLGEHKWDAGGRLDLYFAGSTGFDAIRFFASRETEQGIPAVNPESFFLHAKTKLPYLCRFKGSLSPRQMREDLAFSPAADNGPYRRLQLRW